MVDLATIVYQFFIGLITLSFMIFAHEIGHALMLSKYVKEKVKINWGFWSFKTWKATTVGTREQIDSLNKQQYTYVLIVGILSGFLPYFLLIGLNTTASLLMAFILYLFASKSDFKMILKVSNMELDEI